MNIRAFKKDNNDDPPPHNAASHYYSGKYALSAASVLVLTVLLGSILTTGYIYSYKLNKLTAQVEAANRLHSEIRSLSDAVHKRLQPTKPRRPVHTNLSDIEQNINEIDLLFRELGPSGSLKMGQKLQSEWETIIRIWGEYRRRLPASNHGSQQIIASLHAFNNYAQNTDPLLSDHFQQFNDKLLQYSRSTAAVARNMQLGGVLLIFSGLITFGWRLWRQIKEDREHEAERLETHEILDNLSEGLFLLDRDMNIGSQQSKKLQELLPQIGEGGQNFLELAADILPDRKKLSAVKMFIEQLYNPRVVERLIYGLNPLRKVEVPVRQEGGEERRVLGFHFSRVIQDKKIVKVLVSVRDLTDSVRIEARLQREQEQNDLQIEMISRMLNADESIMRGFLHTSLKQLAQINTILKNPGNNPLDLSNKARLISQEIHAFKGEASVLNLTAFVLAAEAFEDILQNLNSKRPLSGNDFLPLVVELESLLEKVAQAEELHRKMTGRLNNPAPLPVAASATDLGTLFGRFVVNMGYRHNKSVIMETGGLEHLKQDCPSFGAVKDIIIQLLRNAVVHGIEPVRTRTLNGKPSEGRIVLNITVMESKMRILIEDDGRGIDFNAVRAKAVEAKLLTADKAAVLSENQLYGLLFRPGFSTLPENNHDAGRGIGMDIVRDRVKKLGGRISLDTEAGHYTRIVVTLILSGDGHL